MTTLNDLANRLNKALADQSEATWADATLEQWLIEAIREYSAHFPRLRTEAAQSCVASQHAYDLPADCLRLEIVEYPVGEDPPQYLQLYSRKNQDFWGAEGYYDVAYSGTCDDGSDYTRGTLYLSEDPASGQQYQLTYWAPQRLDLASGSAVTVPPEHEHLLILFAVWKACVERLMNEAQSPDTTRDLLDAYRHAGREARTAYDAALAEAVAAASPGGSTGPWRIDDHDRIY